MMEGRSTYEVLTASGYISEQPLSVRKTLVTQELGKRYTLDISSGKPSALFQVDGYIIKQGMKCDKLVLVRGREIQEEAWTQIFVELKGHDAIHGMEQLLATVRSAVFCHASNMCRKARLVATSFLSNKSNPKVEKMRQEFARLKVDYKNLKPGQKDVV